MGARAGLLVITLALAACVTTVPVKQKHADRLAGVQLGMTVSEFRALFPEAYAGGQQISKNGHVIDALEVVDNQYDIMTGNTVRQFLHFYFAEDRLIRWGAPQDWREQEPSVIIEDRRQ